MPPPRASSRTSGAMQTPGRATRSQSRQNTPQPASRPAPRATGVPTVGVGQSFAYGSSGKAVLRGQVATEETTLTSMLQGAIPEEDDNDDDSTASRPQPQRNAGTLPASTLAQHVDDAAEMGRNATAIDHDVPYAPGQAAAGIPVVEPGNLAIAAATLPRYIPQVLRDANKDFWSFLKALMMLLLGLAVFVGVLALAVGSLQVFLYLLTLPSFITPYTARVFLEMNRRTADSPYNLPPAELEQLWVQFRTEHAMMELLPYENLTQRRVDLLQSHYINNLLDRMDALEEKVGLHDKTLQVLENMLPSTLVVREKDGNYEIPESFWQALHQRLSSPDDAAPLWEAFLQTNEQQTRALMRQTASEELDGAVEKGLVISAEVFTAAVNDNQRLMQQHFREELRKSESLMLSKARETAKHEIRESPLHRLSQIQAKALAYANMIVNAQQALNEVNFLSASLGARVNPHLTSPTFKPAGSWFQRMVYDPHPPIAALQPWTEATDCWCAAVSDEMGKAQINVHLAAPIYPTRFVVEHIPPGGTLDISRAPKDFEVWAHVPDETDSFRHAAQGDLSWEGYGQCGDPPTPEHVCIAKNHYDIHGNNWVQTYEIPVRAEHFKLRTEAVIVRVGTNWGGDQTCLYRLRLNGMKV